MFKEIIADGQTDSSSGIELVPALQRSKKKHSKLQIMRKSLVEGRQKGMVVVIQIDITDRHNNAVRN